SGDGPAPCRTRMWRSIGPPAALPTRASRQASTGAPASPAGGLWTAAGTRAGTRLGSPSGGPAPTRAGSRQRARPTPPPKNQVPTGVPGAPAAGAGSPWPVEEPSRVPRGASIRACSARNLAAPPTTASPAATVSRTRAPAGRTRPDTARPKTGAPNSRGSPAVRGGRGAPRRGRLGLGGGRGPRAPPPEGEGAVGDVAVVAGHDPPAHRVGAVG